MTVRTLPPIEGPPTAVRFPPITREELASGLRVWSLPWTPVPVVTVALLLDAGTAQDPLDRPGLASVTGDLLDEGAGGRDVVQLSDAFSRLGTHLDIDVGQDATSLSFTTLSRNFDAAVALLADVVIRPHLADPDLQRIRALRLSRLRQVQTSASAAADRTFLTGVFGAHPYGHGTLGTSRGVEAVTLEQAREFHGRLLTARGATLLVAGDVPADDVIAAARRHFGDWRGADARPALPGPPQSARPVCLLVDRPQAPQSELRVGHLGPSRPAAEFHVLTTLNAALGGQFTSRINRQLREKKGFTYGARTSFDYRRVSGSFVCDTSVQSDATAEAVADVLEEFTAVAGSRPIEGEELAEAQGSLTRGYVRHFETPAHLVRAAAELAKYGLPDDTFDRFVPAVANLTAADVLDAARRSVSASDAIVVIVGDAQKIRPSLATIGREIFETTPEF
jgi:zinc protease